MTKDEIKKLAFEVLGKVFQESKAKGLLSIYLWGSIVSTDFNPVTSDIDAVGILSEDADSEEMDEMREWLPSAEPKLNRLQINFFYLSELKGGAAKSRLARLHDAQQAVFDFPNWIFVVGKRFRVSDFPTVTPAQALKHQVTLVNTRLGWVRSSRYGDRSLEYFCKGLAWLCYGIHKTTEPAGPFSWKNLYDESTTETREFVQVLLVLKSERWNSEKIRDKMPYLTEAAKRLTAKYGH